MKPSSRSGRFKKKLISHEELQIEVPKFLSLFNESLKQFKNNEINESELALHYIVIGLSLRYPGGWLGAYQPNDQTEHNLHSPFPQHIPIESNIKKRLGKMSLGDMVNNFAFKSTPRSVNRALLHFSTGKYPLELMFHIPTPLEVLKQQKSGRRCLSLIIKEDQMKEYILGERDYLSFCLHDLIHADHFYHSNLSYHGQLGLYNLLWQEIEKGTFGKLLHNKDFQREFEYIISDMNAYPIHLLKCLKSAITFYSNQDLFDEWAARFNVESQLLRLNKKDYDPRKEDPVLLDWLTGYLRNELA